jgi:hypothetical protein
MPESVARPEVGLVPLQPSDAVHDVALVVDQVITVLAVQFAAVMPRAAQYSGVRVTVQGLSDIVTSGRGAMFGSTVTLTEREIVPPGPVQSRLNAVLAYRSVETCLPELALLPAQPPEATHPVVFCELHVRPVLSPGPIRVGHAVKVSVGAGGTAATVTVTERLALCPCAFEQVSVKVALALTVRCSVPLVERLPLHAPDAVQAFALLEDHVSRLVPPAETEVGLALNETVGELAAAVCR